ncbi:hypothetical protein L6164_024614 [Bauhinia variegata]|uniref:Uncharacterized protein n=1 Tax=Bauhinia variegata TaxID=167791 RepID=A0ACB9LYB9_BAUVA|nr:hypothetical protein L6164_024614 [Bauhinia variegata]
MKGNTNHNNKKLPPSPPGLPVIGHLHLLRDPLLHRSLHELNEKYGPILYLRFGNRKVLVVSSPSAVEEIFTKNDILFANRPRTLAGKHLGYNNTTIGFSSYNNHWRNLRRLTSLELFSTARIAMCTNIREEEVQLLVKRIFQESSAQASKIEPKPRFRELAFNNMLRMLTGKSFYGDDLVSQEGKEFQALMKEFAELGATFLNDFFPILQWFDYQGVEKRMVKLMNKMDGFVQNLIDDHRRRRSKGEIFSNQERSTLVETMLSLRENEPEFYTDQNIRGVILATPSDDQGSLRSLNLASGAPIILYYLLFVSSAKSYCTLSLAVLLLFELLVRMSDPAQEQDSAPSSMEAPPQDQPTKPGGVTFSIWPPTHRTRDAVINRLIETLSTPSVLSKRYGAMSTDDASAAARQIEDEAFNAAAGSAASDDDGIEILQVYSKEISKRMLDTVKARANSASAVDNGPSQTPTSEVPPSATDAVSVPESDS